MEALKLKHPQPFSSHSFSILHPPSLFLLEDIDVTGAHIGLVAHRIQGSAGPMGCHSSHCKDVMLRFRSHSERLCDSVAGLTRSLSNSIVDWSHIQVLFANRLIASPGVRPIGVGETLCCILRKIVCLLTRDNAESVCGANQLCAGLQFGMEGAIHMVKDLFSITDAKNAFNSINRMSFLRNVRVLWPRASRFIFNTYRGWSSLILKGSNETILCREGIVQGDPPLHVHICYSNNASYSGAGEHY